MVMFLALAALEPQVRGTVLDRPTLVLTPGVSIQRKGSKMDSDGRTYQLMPGDKVSVAWDAQRPICFIAPDTSIFHLHPGTTFVLMRRGGVEFVCLVSGTAGQQLCAHPDYGRHSTYRYGLESRTHDVTPNVGKTRIRGNDYFVWLSHSKASGSQVKTMMGHPDVVVRRRR